MHPFIDVHPLKPVLRSTRLFLLAWALLLAPPAALVHALSHTLPGAPAHSSQPDDGDNPHHAGKVCDACLAFAQLGAALPPDFCWHADAVDVATAAGPTVAAVARRPTLAFHARGPPAASI